MKRVSVVVCFFTLLFFSCRHRRSDDSDGPPMAPTKSNALSPNACATFLVDPRPSVDPGKLKVAAASASLERIDTQGKLYVSKFSAQMDPNQPGDTLYYNACNPTASQCFPGLMLLDDTDVTRPAGSKAAYEYSLPSSSKPYTIEIRSCVRTDRIQAGTKGNGVKIRLPFASDDFYCGPSYKSAQNTSIVFLPREIPNTTLAGKLAKLKQSELAMNQSLYAVMDALNAYDAQDPTKSTQFSQMVSSFVRMREDVFAIANSDYLDQALAGAQKNVASKGLSLAGTSSCVSNGQVDSVLASTSPGTGGSNSSPPAPGGSNSSSPGTGGSNSSSPAPGGSVGDPSQSGEQMVPPVLTAASAPNTWTWPIDTADTSISYTAWFCPSDSLLLTTDFANTAGCVAGTLTSQDTTESVTPSSALPTGTAFTLYVLATQNGVSSLATTSVPAAGGEIVPDAPVVTPTGTTANTWTWNTSPGCAYQAWFCTDASLPITTNFPAVSGCVGGALTSQGTTESVTLPSDLPTDTTYTLYVRISKDGEFNLSTTVVPGVNAPSAPPPAAIVTTSSTANTWTWSTGVGLTYNAWFCTSSTLSVTDFAATPSGCVAGTLMSADTTESVSAPTTLSADTSYTLYVVTTQNGLSSLSTTPFSTGSVATGGGSSGEKQGCKTKCQILLSVGGVVAIVGGFVVARNGIFKMGAAQLSSSPPAQQASFTPSAPQGSSQLQAAQKKITSLKSELTAIKTSELSVTDSWEARRQQVERLEGEIKVEEAKVTNEMSKPGRIKIATAITTPSPKPTSPKRSWNVTGIAGLALLVAGAAIAIAGAVEASQLAETPEQVFIDKFNGLSNTFYKNRAAYQAQQADVVAFLSSEAQ